MKIRKTPFVPALAAVFILCACGGGQPAQPKGPISEDRTAAFKSMMPEFVSMRKMVKGDEVYQVEKFKAAEEKFRAAVEKLNEKAQGGNLEEIKAAYGEVASSCKACHDSFRMKE